MQGFLLLVGVVLWIAGLVDAFMADADRVRVMPKAVWVILILIFSGFGAIAWFVFGRPRVNAGETGGAGSARGAARWGSIGGGLTRPSTSSRTDANESLGWQLGGAGGARRSGPIAPDDDPDFLRQLGRRRPEEPRDPKPDQPA